MIDIVSKRYLYFAISFIVIIPGIIALALWGLPLAIDFTGGSMLEVHFESGISPSTEDVVALFEEMDIQDVRVQTAGEADIVVRSKPIDETTKTEIVSAMARRFNSEITILRFSLVGPSV